MNRRMLRALGLTIAGVSVAEVLLLHWAVLAFHGEGFTIRQSLLGLACVGAFNAVAFPQVRRRVRATGLALVLSRSWIMGSIAALLTGMLLLVALVVIAVGSALVGNAELGRVVFVWFGGAVIVTGFGTVLWGASVGNYRVVIEEIALPLRGVTPELSELRIAHVTDLHIGPLLQPERLRGFVRSINRLQADLIVITGDIFDFDPSYVEAGCRELGLLEARLGVYAVLGNHDVYTGAEMIADAIDRSTSIRLLRDAWETVDVDGVPLVIAGLDDRGERWTEREAEHEALDRIAAEIPDSLACLLLVHRPSYFAHAAKLGFSLLLAGHTHGGQVALPLAHHHNPSRMISRHTRGVFKRGETTLYVNRGLGMAGLPLRINCPREIALIRFAEPA
ncbi:MAG: metallophosphoesterase [Myxococcota bacterium]|nr:metallophosphoesterase [Myxococcota bacterium]